MNKIERLIEILFSGNNGNKGGGGGGDDEQYKIYKGSFKGVHQQ